MSVNSGQTLSHYRLVEKIGEGGMGVVWKAEDTVLGRTVAIKVLPADTARDEERRRMFLDEARLASSVSDAHIAQVHELGREGDLDFIVMEYVEGKPLSKILHGRPLPPDKVANLGLQVARALSRAHRKGLLHRDLKPANILVTSDGDVKVVDFGLATLFANPVSNDGSEETTRSLNEQANGSQSRPAAPQAARLAGTLPYMSPEQARGETLDARSDIFSLGIVLYEMTTGQRPFSGATSAELLHEILTARTRQVHDLVPKVPLDLDRIIQKAMAAGKVDRYQTMEDLAVDLKRLGRDLESGSSPSYDDLKEAQAPGRRRRIRIAILAGTLALPILAILGWMVNSQWSVRGTDPRTILILPFEVHGQGEDPDFVGRAFAEALAIDLAQTKELEVLPIPNSADLHESGAMGRVGAAREAGAGRLLTGALAREGKAIEARLSLVDTGRNRILWGTQQKSEDGDLPKLASAVAREVRAQLGAPAPRLYEYFRYVAGSPAMAGSLDLTEALQTLRQHDLPKALAATERLTRAFPNDPQAFVLRMHALMDALNEDASEPSRSRFERGLADLRRVDPLNPYIDIVRGWILSELDSKPEEAAILLDRTLARDDLTPANRAYALRNHAAARNKLKQTSAALRDLDEALRLDPANLFTFTYLSDVLKDAGRFDEAVTRARQAAALDPSGWWIQSFLASALESAGKREEALGIRSKLCETNPTQDSFGAYAYALIRAGHEARALEIAKKTEKMGEDGGAMYNLACIWAIAKRPAEALRLLHKSLELGFYPKGIAEDEDLVSLHVNREFASLVTKVRKQTKSEP